MITLITGNEKETALYWGPNGYPHPHSHHENLSISHFDSFAPLAFPAADPVPFCPPLTQQLPVELILYKTRRKKMNSEQYLLTEYSVLYNMFYIVKYIYGTEFYVTDNPMYHVIAY